MLCRKHSKYWTRSWNHKYGNCYTFNNGLDNNGRKLRTLKASQPGPSQGNYSILYNVTQVWVCTNGLYRIKYDDGNILFSNNILMAKYKLA